MRHAIMRSCKHARRAPSADAAAQSQHAGHVSALGEAQFVVERPGALVLDVPWEELLFYLVTRNQGYSKPPFLLI